MRRRFTFFFLTVLVAVPASSWGQALSFLAPSDAGFSEKRLERIAEAN